MLRKIKKILSTIYFMLNGIDFKYGNKIFFVKKKNKQIENICSKIKENGFYVIENYISEELCDIIKNDIDNIIASNKNKTLYDSNSNEVRIYRADKHSELIKQYNQDQFIHNIGEHFLNLDIKALFTLANIVTADKKSIYGSGGGWHRDSTWENQFKSMLYVNDVNKENGPFQYISGTNKKISIFNSIIRNNIQSNQNRINQKSLEDILSFNPQYKLNTFEGKKGTLILFNSFGIHRGSKLNLSSRYALTNYYFTKIHLKKDKELIEKKFNLL